MAKTKEKKQKERVRKVFVPILVVDSTKVKFDSKKGSRTADAYLQELMKK